MLLSLLPVILEACRRAFPGRSLAARLGRIRLLAALSRSYPDWIPLVAAPVTTAAGLLFEERPETLAAAIRPYQDTTWSARTRLHRIVGHCRELDRLGAPFVFSTRKAVVLADLGDLHPGLELVMDQPARSARQGLLTLSLCLGPLRARSVSFSFLRSADGGLAIRIGGSAGGAPGAVPELEAAWPPSDAGPGDLLLDCLRGLARAIGAESLRAVSDRARPRDPEAVGGSDDAFWRRAGGVPIDPDAFDLPLLPSAPPPQGTDPATPDSGTRGQAAFDGLAERIATALPKARPVFRTIR